MKQSTLIFLILFSLLVTLLISSTNAVDEATMTLNSFELGGDGGGPSKCDGNYHSNESLVVALSTRWYINGARCGEFITIYYNDKSVKAKVVDECDSTSGCGDSIVDASKAVWNTLEVPSSQYGETTITWSDA